MSEKLDAETVVEAFARETRHKHGALVWPGTQALMNLVNAAEERGRRRGVEEIREALRSVACEHCHKGFFDDPATWGCGSCKALRAALAPRDSAPVAAPQAIPGTHAARREREKARDSGKKP